MTEDLKKINPREKAVLRKLVLYTCTSCNRHEERVGKLTPHRIKKGRDGGIYHLNNIRMLCNYNGLIDNVKSCHKRIHENDMQNVRFK